MEENTLDIGKMGGKTFRITNIWKIFGNTVRIENIERILKNKENIKNPVIIEKMSGKTFKLKKTNAKPVKFEGMSKKSLNFSGKKC